MRRATIASVAFLLTIASTPAIACSCAFDGSYTVEDYIDKAAVIIIGRVLELKPMPADTSDPLTKQFLKTLGLTGNDAEQLTVISSCGSEWVRVAVTEQIKGESRTEITLAREEIGTACDVSFPLLEGREYLLFGVPGRDGSTLYLSGCSPSLPAGQATRMIRKIRKRLARAS